MNKSANKKISIELLLQAIFVALISIYGTQVCPHVNALGNFTTTVYFTVGSIPFFLIRIMALKRVNLIQRNPFIFDILYFLLLGTAIGIYNTSFHGFPIASTYKLLLGALTLGVFTSIIFSLIREKSEAQLYFSIIKSSVLFISFILVTIISICILLIMEDVNYAKIERESGMMNFVMKIVIEFTFVFVIVLGYIITIVSLFRKGLIRSIEDQIETMKAVGSGDLSTMVDIHSNNELGVIAKATNEMIVELREKEKYKSSIDKLVSKDISSMIVDRIDSGNFKPERKNVCVLFTDIQGFTEECENSIPEEFVKKLNNHFELVVGSAEEFSGIINKFIGDAVLMYFEGENAKNNALQCADRLLHLAEVQGAFKIGVGIAKGDVMSGLIGSKNRLEYTIIGSTVNKAARLESLTRTLKCSVVVCDDTLKGSSLSLGFREHQAEIKGFQKIQTVHYK